MATVEVTTHEFERSHRKLPRGVGCWAFQFPSTVMGGEAHTKFFSASYGNAKKAACAHARSIGAMIIAVLP